MKIIRAFELNLNFSIFNSPFAFCSLNDAVRIYTLPFALAAALQIAYPDALANVQTSHPLPQVVLTGTKSNVR
jgi:hypothetical protein